MVSFNRLMVPNKIIRRPLPTSSFYFSKSVAPVRRLMNTTVTPPVSTNFSDITGRFQAYSVRNKETLALLSVLGTLLLTGIAGVGSLWSRISSLETKVETELNHMATKEAMTKLETEVQNIDKNTVRKDVVAKLETELQNTVGKEVVAKLATQIENVIQMSRREGEFATQSAIDKAQKGYLQNFINRETSIAGGKASRDE